ncbi:MAG: hypothetical protein ABI085_09460 [Gemmatimonadaceae bacterium]
MAARAKNNLVALGSVAVFTVYGAGFMRTKAAAARLDSDTDDRRPPLPGQRTGPVRPIAAVSSAPVTSAQPSTPAALAAAAKPAVGSIATVTANAQSDSAKTQTASADAKPATQAVQKPTPMMPIAPTTVANAPASTPAPPTQVQAPVAPAPAPAPAPAHDSSNNANSAAVADSIAQNRPLKDGTFTGWGTSRHGDIQATVMIKSGKIFFAAISECMTQYSCSWINALPPEVVARQSADVDYVSGATQSTIAFYRAVLEAMSKAK